MADQVSGQRVPKRDWCIEAWKRCERYRTPTQDYVCAQLSISLILMALEVPVTSLDWTARIAEMCTRLLYDVEQAARRNELERIQAATLDANTDVWSTTDDGQIISLTERIKALAVFNTVPG